MKILGQPLLAIAAAVGGMLISAPALADVDCGGIPTYISNDQNGYMAVNWGWGTVVLCNLNTAITGTSGQTALTPDGCKALYTMLTTAQTTGKAFYLHVTGISSCSAIAGSNSWPAGPYPYWWITN